MHVHYSVARSGFRLAWFLPRGLALVGMVWSGMVGAQALPASVPAVYATNALPSVNAMAAVPASPDVSILPENPTVSTSATTSVDAHKNTSLRGVSDEAAPAALAPSALPPLPDQSDPWLYRGSDVPHDKAWYFGTLPNGLRWAVHRNSVPPGQVSIRIRMDVGSLNEKMGEEGFAHLLEHLVFRQSRYLGEAQAIPAWQRLGATFGTDTNAETTPIHTVFKIDLPDAIPASIDTSFKLLSGMMIAPTLSESDIRTEVPIVLAEKRDNGGAAERVADATREVFFAGQPLADHATIGSDASVNGAHQVAVREFHTRWYRPENAAIIVAGDADPRLIVALITKWFGHWRVAGPHVPTPDFGKPVPAAGGDSVGLVRVLVQPGVPRALTYAIERPWHEKHDTIIYNQGQLIDQIAQAIINRRLEDGARDGAPWLAAQVGQENDDRSLDATYVAITPLDHHWRAALGGVRAVILDAMTKAPTSEEVAREVAETKVAFDSQVQQQALRPGGAMADDLVQALDIHETVASPAVVRDIFLHSIPLFTPEAILAHTKALFTGAVLRALYVTPDASDANDVALNVALHAPVKASAADWTRHDTPPITFSELPAIGAIAPMPVARKIGLLDIQQLDFANNVHVLMWPTDEDPGRVNVSVRFGAGLRAFAPGDMAVAAVGSLALVSSGEGKLGQNELDRVTAGRKLGYNFQIDEGDFTFSAETRAEDLADQLYLFADKFAAPRWDAEPVQRALALAEAQNASLSASPQSVLAGKLKYLQHDRDPRYNTPDPAELALVTPAAFQDVWAPILANGPIEIEIYGDFSGPAAIEALRRSFGALAQRSSQPVFKASDAPAFAAPNAQPLVLYHQGDANQAAAVVSWPTGGGIGGLRVSRRLEVLAQLFQNRLMLAIREKTGASYAPQVASDWPIDLTSGGSITALAQLRRDKLPEFFTTVDSIARDLAAKPPSADELALVTGPMREEVMRAISSTAFIMSQIAGSTADPARLDNLHGLLADYAEISPLEVQRLAQLYLRSDKAWHLEVVPTTQTATMPASHSEPVIPSR